MSTWLYIFDEFKPLDISIDKLLELIEVNPLRLFEEVKDILTEYVKEIKHVKIYNTYFNPHGFEFLIEYLVECEFGEVSVKVIHSNNPMVILQKYYEYGKRKK